MSAYDRQIAYLSLYENGIRKGNAGFLKWESDSIVHKLEVHIKGLWETDTTETLLQTKDGRILDKIRITAGIGDYRLKETGQELGIDRIPAKELCGLFIVLPGNRALEAEWVNRLGEKNPSSAAPNVKPLVAVPREKAAETVPWEKPQEAAPEEKAAETTPWEKPQEAVPEGKSLELLQVAEQPKQEISADSSIDKAPYKIRKSFESEIKDSKKGRKYSSPVSYESKWQQLMDMFETIRPFSDERIFIKVSPGDFYILRESFQHLSNNSFLLHGFYNYQYLILGCKNGSLQEEYLLGVPGVYYEREILAARMFGFEGFESIKKECEQGSFGYYMVSVEI